MHSDKKKWIFWQDQCDNTFVSNLQQLKTSFAMNACIRQVDQENILQIHLFDMDILSLNHTIILNQWIHFQSIILLS